MNEQEFAFVESYVAGLPAPVRYHPEYPYALQEGLGPTEIHRLAQANNMSIPKELQGFYTLSYGASLGEYSMLTISEIAALTGEMQATYEEAWIDTMIPFAYVRDLGNAIVFDLGERGHRGRYSIKDAFHELEPHQWDTICYGLETWLRKMVAHDFRPFWLESPR